MEQGDETDAANLTLDAIHQAEQSLKSNFNEIEISNSKLPINKINPDILYDIFTLAVDNSNRDPRALLAISQVCRHWRKSALGWPTLWGPIDLSNPDAIVELYIQRSKNVPLTLICQWIQPSPSKVKLFSKVSKVLSRLCSLTLRIPHRDFMKIRGAFHSLQSPLQHLNVSIDLDSYDRQLLVPPTDFLHVDISHLQNMFLLDMSLPSSKLSHDRLSHFVFRTYATDPPSLVRLFDFVSGCPLLYKLDLRISTTGIRRRMVTSSIISQSLPDNQLDLPNLKILNLQSDTGETYIYLRNFLSRIRSLGPLSQLSLLFFQDPRWYFGSRDLALLPPFNDLKAAPLEALSRPADEHFLFVLIQEVHGHFKIFTKTRSSPSYPLAIAGSCSKRPSFDRSPFLKFMFMCAMPALTHLVLRSHAWEFFTSWNLDIQRIFPCLEKLELSYPAESVDTTQVLNSLHAGLKLKTLAIGRAYDIPFTLITDAILRTSTENFEIDNYWFRESSVDLRERYLFIADLRKRGLVVTQRRFPDDDSLSYSGLADVH